MGISEGTFLRVKFECTNQTNYMGGQNFKNPSFLLHAESPVKVEISFESVRSLPIKLRDGVADPCARASRISFCTTPQIPQQDERMEQSEVSDCTDRESVAQRASKRCQC